MKLQLQAFGQNFENWKMPKIWILFARPLKIFFSKTAQQNSEILHTNRPWVCVIKVCSNGGTNYIIGEIIAKDNLNIENFMQTFENLLLQIGGAPIVIKLCQKPTLLLHKVKTYPL